MNPKIMNGEAAGGDRDRMAKTQRSVQIKLPDPVPSISDACSLDDSISLADALDSSARNGSLGGCSSSEFSYGDDLQRDCSTTLDPKVLGT